MVIVTHPPVPALGGGGVMGWSLRMKEMLKNFFSSFVALVQEAINLEGEAGVRP